MARQKNNDDADEGLPEWMATYCDLITLVVTFFVLLFSMASIDVEKFTAVFESIRGSFSMYNMSDMMYDNSGDQMLSILDATNAREDRPVPEPGSKEYEEYVEYVMAENATLKAELESLTGSDSVNENESVDENENQNDKEKEDEGERVLTEEEKLFLELEEVRKEKLENFRTDIQGDIEALGIGGYVSIVEEKDKLVLRLNSQMLFDSASATIKPDGRDVLFELGQSFQDLDHHIDVQGHTDSRRINTAQFPSNWELSNQRATNVVRFLQDECKVDPIKLRSTGFGEYQPIGDNATEEGRLLNRRIDIVITD